NLFNKIELVSNRTLMGNQVEILVEEKISSLVRFGLRIDNEYLTQLLVDLRDENVFGTGTEIGSVIQFGSRSRSFVLEHKANRVFDSYFNYKLRAFLNFNDINTYINDSTVSDSRFSRSKLSEYRQINSGLSLAIGTQVRKFGNLTIEGRLFEAEVKNKIDYTGDSYKQNVASLRVGLSVDSQNKYPFPTKGFLVKGFYETAQKLLGTDLAFSKLFFDYKSISEIAEDHTLSPRFVAGFADETLPLSEQFSLGGQNTFFGLRDHEFRGRQIFLTSIEYRFKLPVKLFFDAYIKARYDLGSIWSKREELKFKDFKHGIGASFSLDTPIGPADFSLGRSFIIKKVTSENIAAWGPLFFYFTIGYYY
ncbi:MAG: outer membrane protein assembly factor, partial [Ignavibacteriales bacterium]|nr:outer membrane protein assembly factor [Ignavibacteriales bacterium]